MIEFIIQLEFSATYETQTLDNQTNGGAPKLNAILKIRTKYN